MSTLRQEIVDIIEQTGWFDDDGVYYTSGEGADRILTLVRERLTSDEAVAKAIRDEWVRYCLETGNTKPSHIAPWEELDDWNQEADRRIARAAIAAALDAVMGGEG